MYIIIIVQVVTKPLHNPTGCHSSLSKCEALGLVTMLPGAVRYDARFGHHATRRCQVRSIRFGHHATRGRQVRSIRFGHHATRGRQVRSRVQLSYFQPRVIVDGATLLLSSTPDRKGKQTIFYIDKKLFVHDLLYMLLNKRFDIGTRQSYCPEDK